jgi:hypothetical protein
LDPGRHLEAKDRALGTPEIPGCCVGESVLDARAVARREEHVESDLYEALQVEKIRQVRVQGAVAAQPG